MFSYVPLRPMYKHASVCLSCFDNFHFRHNQLSLYVNLVCFDRISLNDNFSNQALFDRVLVRVLLVYALRKSGRQTSAQMKLLTGKACMQIMHFCDRE